MRASRTTAPARSKGGPETTAEETPPACGEDNVGRRHEIGVGCYEKMRQRVARCMQAESATGQPVATVSVSRLVRQYTIPEPGNCGSHVASAGTKFSV